MNGVILSYAHYLDLDPFEKTPMGVIKIPEISLGEAAILKMLKGGIDEITVITDCGSQLWAQSITAGDEDYSVNIYSPVIGRGAVGCLNELRLMSGLDHDGCFVHPDNIVSAVDVSILRRKWLQGPSRICAAVVVPGATKGKANGYTVTPPKGYRFSEMCIVSDEAIQIAMDHTDKDSVSIMDMYQACEDKDVLECIPFDGSFFVVENQTNLRMLLK